MANEEIASLIAKLVLDVSGFTKGMNETKKELDEITKDNAAEKFGESAKSAAKGMTLLGTGILGAAGYASKAVIDFKPVFTLTKKTDIVMSELGSKQLQTDELILNIKETGLSRSL